MVFETIAYACSAIRAGSATIPVTSWRPPGSKLSVVPPT